MNTDDARRRGQMKKRREGDKVQLCVRQELEVFVSACSCRETSIWISQSLMLSAHLLAAKRTVFTGGQAGYQAGRVGSVGRHAVLLQHQHALLFDLPVFCWSARPSETRLERGTFELNFGCCFGQGWDRQWLNCSGIAGAVRLSLVE